MKDNKTIVFVTASTNLRGGDFSLLSIIKMLEKKGIQSLVIISKEGKSAEFWRKNNVKYICIPFKTWTAQMNNVVLKHMSFYAKRIYHKYYVKKYKRQIREMCNDRILCIYNNGFTNYFAYELSDEFNLKCIQHIREFGDLDFNLNFELGKNQTFSKIQNKCSGIIAISETVKKSFSRGKNYEKIKVIYNGIKPKKVLENNLEKNDESNIKIVMSGNLSPEKKHLDLLKAVELLVNEKNDSFKVDIYGNGIQKAKIEEYIKEHNLEKYVELKGFVIDIPYEKYDIGIMASHSEAFGRVTVEYMMNGLAVIASNSGANPEIIRNNVDGILYESDNYLKLADSIKCLINNKEKIDMLKQNAKETANKRFTEEIYVKNIYNFLIETKIIQ